VPLVLTFLAERFGTGLAEPMIIGRLLVSENRRTRLWTTLIGAFIPPQCPRNW
jgi:hypothetical protein